MLCPDIADLPSPPVGKTGWPWTISGPPARRLGSLDALPRISIVTPSFNQGQFIEETIRSVLLQGYPNIEYFVIDGGSSDQTLEVLRKYEPWLSGWLSEPDQGQSDAINKGWGRVSGEWLAWMNADDTYMPGALWVLAKEIRECADCGILVGSAVWTDASGKVIHHQIISGFDYIDFLLRLRNHPPSGSTLIRRSVVDAVGGLDVSMNMICDTEYWMRAGLNAKVHTTTQEISTFRVHAECKTLKFEPTKAHELIRAYDKLFTQRNLPSAVQQVKRRAYSFCYLEAARYALRTSDERACWRYLYLSLLAGWQYIGCGHLSVAVQKTLGQRVSEFICRTLRRETWRSRWQL